MPPEALSLALAGSIYPPALAAVIALGRGPHVRLRVLLFVVGAFVTVLVTGSLMLFLFNGAVVTNRQAHTASSALYVVAGMVLIWLAIRLRNPHPGTPKKAGGPSKTDRYLKSNRMVFVLGVVLYVIPSPIFVGLVNAIADTQASGAQKFLYLVAALLVMLWMIEIPMLMLLAFPARASRVLGSINAWFGRNGRLAAAVAAAGAGVYLIGVGLAELLSFAA